MNDLANFAADLRRISYWTYKGQKSLAVSMLKKIKELYKGINPKIGCYENIWNEVEKIENLEGGKYKAAERALTASVILLGSSWKT